MLSIEGIYENGQLILNETPEMKSPVKVIVTFLENIGPQASKKPKNMDIESQKNKFSELIRKIGELSSAGNSVEDIRVERSR